MRCLGPAGRSPLTQRTAADAAQRGPRGLAPLLSPKAAHASPESSEALLRITRSKWKPRYQRRPGRDKRLQADGIISLRMYIALLAESM